MLDMLYTGIFFFFQKKHLKFHWKKNVIFDRFAQNIDLTLLMVRMCPSHRFASKFAPLIQGRPGPSEGLPCNQMVNQTYKNYSTDLRQTE